MLSQNARNRNRLSVDAHRLHPGGVGDLGLQNPGQPLAQPLLTIQVQASAPVHHREDGRHPKPAVARILGKKVQRLLQAPFRQGGWNHRNQLTKEL
jgi:hypothetical protein